VLNLNVTGQHFFLYFSSHNSLGSSAPYMMIFPGADWCLFFITFLLYFQAS
jgi:hypothetical protein